MLNLPSGIRFLYVWSILVSFCRTKSCVPEKNDFFFFFVLGELEAKQKWWRTFGLNHWCGMISYHTSLQSSLIFFCLIVKSYSFLRRLVVDCSFYPNSVFDKHAPKFRVWYVVLIFQAIRAWCDIKLFLRSFLIDLSLSNDWYS